jgi:TDG/mug DNA glycosylase family protein
MSKPVLLTSLPPLAAAHARVLILGSMPGARSLAEQQYYAHPHNLFWPFMGELFGAGPALDYARRTERLRACGVAVWDVLRHCQREGSLDSRIQVKSEVANDFAAFFAAHPGLRAVFFNGRKAEASFRRHVAATPDRTALPCILLPSTSPANASQRPADRLRAWQQILSWTTP